MDGGTGDFSADAVRKMRGAFLLGGMISAGLWVALIGFTYGLVRLLG